ncbi:MAG: hypothetical protein VB082_04080 [Christensenella sp.]|nr:hypothetical protein [Christensenella sp.]
MSCYYIIGLRVSHRTHNSLKLQQLLTEYGCNIKMRVGLHETSEEYCSDDGLIILQACGGKDLIERMVASFSKVEGVTAKMMELD